jgi:hypothetical protein
MHIKEDITYIFYDQDGRRCRVMAIFALNFLKIYKVIHTIGLLKHVYIKPKKLLHIYNCSTTIC